MVSGMILSAGRLFFFLSLGGGRRRRLLGLVVGRPMSGAVHRGLGDRLCFGGCLNLAPFDRWLWRLRRDELPVSSRLVVLLLTEARLAAVFVNVFSVAGRATRLANAVFDEGDNRVISEASLTWTVVVHDVAKTQRALLHSILPTNVHNRFSARPGPANGSGISYFRRAQFQGYMHPDTEGRAILQVVVG
jgi:hypothetical protein